MSPSMTERRLMKVAERLKVLREELRVIDEQVQYFDEIADETRTRSIVAETPIADQEHREAQRHADAMARNRDRVLAEIAGLERSQDELLDRFMTESRRP